MKQSALMIALTLAAGPALANYGDVDMQIETVKLEAFAQAPVLVEPQIQSASAAAGTCRLSQEHLVSVPAEFTPSGSVTVACLDD